VGDCFLCKPRKELVYASTDEGVALCGLGPLVPGYSIVATRAHLRSAADARKVAPSLSAFVSRVREVLVARFGRCVLSEHGRVPACADISGTTDPHCYHAHFLLFPGSPNIEERAQKFFAASEFTSSLDDALTIAANWEEYFLISDAPNSFRVLTRPGKFIRQFARILVTDAMGLPSTRANWRKHPNDEQAAREAESLRTLFSSAQSEKSHK
jgi:hypothetical protein